MLDRTVGKRLGHSGLQVSSVVLGCMGFGAPNRGTHGWSLGEEESRTIIRQAVEAGITTFDTADVYSDGSSEEYVGRALSDFARRDEIVIATKVHGRMGPSANQAGLSRLHILSGINASLKRLRTEHIDLYQIHRWDPFTPIEETMEALNDVVRSGKARYIGASSMWAWQLAKAQHVATQHGWTPFVSMQDHYNLLQREEEREMHPYCLDSGIGVLPWSPLARGRLTRSWGEGTARADSDGFASTLYRSQVESNRAIVEAVAQVARDRGVPRAQIALAWVMHQSAVTSPIFGATRPQHVDDAVSATSIRLESAEVERLEAAYTPRSPEGF